MQTYVQFELDPRRTSATVSLESSHDLLSWQTITTSALGAPATLANEAALSGGGTRVLVTLPPAGEGGVEDTYLRFRVTVP